jgi:tetratricopeptide (TPR) repeat protein
VVQTAQSTGGGRDGCATWFPSLAGVMFAGAVLAAYANTFAVPFVYDDVPAILENTTLHQLGSGWFPPPGTTASGRPLVNFSLALNYALSGYAVWSYHALNLLIHLGATLTLFGLVRRTLRLPSLAAKWGQVADPVALSVAALWALHPTATESVTYTVQRAESLMGWCYLGTMYGFVRSVTTTGAATVRWRVFTVAVCLLGMLSKEVMVSAPLMVLLFDRTFVGGSFAAARRRRKRLYLALAVTWIPLAWLVASGGGTRGGTAGFGSGLTWLNYGLTQFEAIARYLGLAVWPDPLIFEYGPFLVRGSGDVVPYALLVVPLAVGTVVALWKKPGWGFLGAWFFAMLAVTSLVPGTTQMIVEHRMYLSLAAVAVVVVLGLHAWLGRPAWLVALGLAVVLGVVTARRNADYRTAVTLWSATVAARPDNALAHGDLANALVGEGRVAEAIPHYEIAVRLAPMYPVTHYDFALALGRVGRTREALAEYERALALRPGFARAHAEAGLLLFEDQRPVEAIAHYEQALRGLPRDAELQGNLANALFVAGRVDEALAHYAEALRLQPDDPEVHYNLGSSLFRLRRFDEALREFDAALRARENFPDAHYNAALALLQLGRRPEAVPRLERALAQRSDFAAARDVLARLKTGHED